MKKKDNYKNYIAWTPKLESRSLTSTFIYASCDTEVVLLKLVIKY